MKTYTLQKIIISTFLLAGIILLFVSNPLFRLVLLLTMPFSALLLFFITKNRPFFFLMIATLSYCLMALFRLIYLNSPIYYSFLTTFIACIIVSHSILTDPKIYKYFFSFFYLATIVLLITLFFTDNPNDIFVSSRNSVSLLLVPTASIFILKPLENYKYSIVTLCFIIFICCLLAQGRSGIITSLLLLIGASLRYLNNKQRLTLGIVALSILFITFYYTPYLDYLMSSGLKDTSRNNFVSEYFRSLSSYTFLIGNDDFSTLPLIASFQNNPHNQYVRFHSYFGILFVFFLFFIAIFMLKKISLANIFIYTAILFRFFTDTVDGFMILSFVLPFYYLVYSNITTSIK